MLAKPEVHEAIEVVSEAENWVRTIVNKYLVEHHCFVIEKESQKDFPENLCKEFDFKFWSEELHCDIVVWFKKNSGNNWNYTISCEELGIRNIKSMIEFGFYQYLVFKFRGLTDGRTANVEVGIFVNKII